jgi:3-oxoacyl-[acyl-carrier-protein] synthase-3
MTATDLHAASATRRAIDPNRTTPRFGVRPLGLGAAVPRRRVSNHDLADRLDTSDAWIVGRTGIRARRVADATETTAALAAAAGRRALDRAGLTGAEVDLVLVATSTPDSACPATASRVAARLDLRAGGFDVNGACCGFVHALHTASALLADPALGTALVIGADRYTSIVDPDDRATAILFGDGAGAAVLTGGDTRPGAPGILGADLGGDARGIGIIEVPPGTPHLTMDGPCCSGGPPAGSSPRPPPPSVGPGPPPPTSTSSSPTRPTPASWAPPPTASASTTTR